jgi:hypothetical protein
MTELDNLFGKPSSDKLPSPKNILPQKGASAASRPNDGTAGRDVMLTSSPFALEAEEFFNSGSDEREIEVPKPQGPFPQIAPFGEDQRPIVGDPSSIPPVDRQVDSFTDLFGPSIDTVSRLGDLGGVDSSNMSLDQIREAVRSVLRKVEG